MAGSIALPVAKKNSISVRMRQGLLLLHVLQKDPDPEQLSLRTQAGPKMRLGAHSAH